METGLSIIESTAAVQLFTPGFLDPIVGRVEREAREEAAKLDISTVAGRKAIASLSFKVAKSKTFIDGKRKELVADEKKRLAAIDADGRTIWNRLEALQEEVRKPLTDWEESDKVRVAAEAAAREKDRNHKAEINKAAVVGLMSIEGMTAAMARNIITAIAKGQVPNVKVVY